MKANPINAVASNGNYHFYSKDLKKKINKLNEEIKIITNTNPFDLYALKAKVQEIHELYQVSQKNDLFSSIRLYKDQ